jgi:hypothetical protein
MLLFELDMGCQSRHILNVRSAMLTAITYDLKVMVAGEAVADADCIEQD